MDSLGQTFAKHTHTHLRKPLLRIRAFRPLHETARPRQNVFVRTPWKRQKSCLKNKCANYISKTSTPNFAEKHIVLKFPCTSEAVLVSIQHIMQHPAQQVCKHVFVDVLKQADGQTIRHCQKNTFRHTELLHRFPAISYCLFSGLHFVCLMFAFEHVVDVARVWGFACSS